MEPITRQEQLLNSIATGNSVELEPITREEQYLSAIAGLTDFIPEKPITRKEMFYEKILEGGGAGGGKEEQEKTVDITENGTVEVVADEGKTLSKVTANVNVASGGGNDETLRAVVEGNAAEIILPNSVSKIGDSKFREDSTLKNIQGVGLTSIGEHAFNNCTNLALTKLPAGLTYIGQRAFYNCKKLNLTELPVGLTYIGQGAFSGCIYLALTELPAAITNISSQAFMQCSGLTTITFKGKPSTIHNNAFQYCGNLKTVNVPWAEGEVANAPWGASSATINYNYTGV